ncbi:glutathione transport system substrate-binding protein [Xaviernesmea oryzae]|uniref:Glutathione transport system substrate-binding protein n=1 Tax=Xaviernesmea oryzae TaxID=464029 RepID=A0A1X7DX05_9HYPH|nr:ABC transporter substrate-binding protein [Xaviernesmea oryzae]SMF23151.1 glutathione transport system substrate-binding protein [Xaviernesmea oryzae]
MKRLSVMKIHRRTLLTGALGMAAAMATFVPGGAYAADQILKFGLSANVGNLVYGPSRGAAQFIVNQQIHRGLVKFDENGTLVPALAESFKAIDSSTYSFTLREGLKFHDGSPIEASTVKASLEYLADKKVGAAIYSALSTLESIETPDERTLIVKLSKPNASFLEYMADPNAGISPAAALATGAANWIGAGPFKLRTNENGVSLDLVKADTYYDKDEVKLDGVKFVFYPDSSARTNALLAGDVDVIDFVGWEDFERVEAAGNLVLDAVPGPFVYTMFNIKRAPFDNPKVRQAIAHAIKPENVVAVAFYGHGTPLNGIPMSPNNDRYDPSMGKLWGYDPAKARALLTEAGVADGLKIKLLTSSTYSFFRDMALSMQADLKAVGIDAELDAPDWATYTSQKASGGYDLAVGGGAPSVAGPVYLQAYVVGAPASSFGSYGYDASAIVAHIQAGEAQSDNATARAEYLKAVQIVGEDVPFLPLAQRSQAYAYSDRVEGFKNVPGFLSITGTGYMIEKASIR